MNVVERDRIRRSSLHFHFEGSDAGLQFTTSWTKTSQTDKQVITIFKWKELFNAEGSKNDLHCTEIKPNFTHWTFERFDVPHCKWR